MQITSSQRLVYWIFFLLLIVIGILKIVFTKLGMEGSHKFTTGISMLLSILIVLFLSIAREAYAITVIFMLLVIKGILLLKYSKVSSWWNNQEAYFDEKWDKTSWQTTLNSIYLWVDKDGEKEEYRLPLNRERNSSAERFLEGRDLEGSFGIGTLN